MFGMDHLVKILDTHVTQILHELPILLVADSVEHTHGMALHVLLQVALKHVIQIPQEPMIRLVVNSVDLMYGMEAIVHTEGTVAILTQKEPMTLHVENSVDLMYGMGHHAKIPGTLVIQIHPELMILIVVNHTVETAYVMKTQTSALKIVLFDGLGII